MSMDLLIFGVIGVVMLVGVFKVWRMIAKINREDREAKQVSECADILTGVEPDREPILRAELKLMASQHGTMIAIKAYRSAFNASLPDTVRIVDNAKAGRPLTDTPTEYEPQGPNASAMITAATAVM